MSCRRHSDLNPTSNNPTRVAKVLVQCIVIQRYQLGSVQHGMYLYTVRVQPFDQLNQSKSVG